VREADDCAVTGDLQGLRELSANISGRTDATHNALRNDALARGIHVSADDRVGEADLSALLGMSAGTLRNKRREGAMPPHYRVGGHGHRVTYRLREVAEWIEAGREY
jgi:predicted DNA-binding transcriptional regulator AlpA